MRAIKRIIIHHSASPDDFDVAKIDKEHKARGFSGIGYHFLIHREPVSAVWLVSKARNIEEIGAHDQGQNSDSVGVCLAGNYSQDPIPLFAWQTLLNTVACLCKKSGLTQANVEGHRENEPSSTPTECPGKNFDINKFRHDLANRLMWV